jgi:hypothetical protein
LVNTSPWSATRFFDFTCFVSANISTPVISFDIIYILN